MNHEVHEIEGESLSDFLDRRESARRKSQRNRDRLLSSLSEGQRRGLLLWHFGRNGTHRRIEDVSTMRIRRYLRLYARSAA